MNKKKFWLYVLVVTDAGTTASTGLSRKAKAKTAKEDYHRPKLAKVIYPSTQTDKLASRPPLRNLWVSSFFFIYVFYFINPLFCGLCQGLGLFTYFLVERAMLSVKNKFLR